MSVPDLPRALIWTDGSCSGGKGHGGWAALVVTYPDDEIQRDLLTGDEADTTNNRMEMRAAIEGMSFLTRPHRIYLVSDSAYLVNTMKEKWYVKWGKNAEFYRPNWDLWQQLIQLVTYHDVEFLKVRGHADDPYNNHVDKEAMAARLKGQNDSTDSQSHGL